MLNNFYRAIIRRAVPVDIYVQSQVNASGDWIESYASGTAKMTCFPLKPEMLRYQAEGGYTHKDRVFYQVQNGIKLAASVMAGDTILNTRSIIKNAGLNYRVNETFDYRADGGFIEYYAKMIDEDEL